MRFLLFLLLCSLQAGAATYYISDSDGDDRNSVAQARNPRTPWKSLAHLNWMWPQIKPGDSVLLKRGDVFFGQLVVGKNGAQGAPLYIGAYGRGGKPVISGFQQLTQWRSMGANRFEAEAPLLLGKMPSVVTVNGKLAGMGRYPNATAADKGYLIIDAHSGKNSLTDEALNGSPHNWTGAGIAVRTNHYIIDTGRVTAHQNNTVSFTPDAEYELKNRYGFFFQNDMRTLDEEGEWFYDPATNKLRLFLNRPPQGNQVRVAAIDTLVVVFNRDHIVLENLRLEGANKFGFYHYSAAFNAVRNCEVQYIGDIGIRAAQKDNTHFTATGNNICDVLACGIDLRGTAAGIDVQQNTIERIGLIPGMGGSGTHVGIGIIFNAGGNHEVAYNRMDSLGYAGIRWGGNDVSIHHNYISNFCMVLDDGGGIYTGNRNRAPQSNRKVFNNIILHGIGAPVGTANNANQGSGIYHDDNSEDIETFNNVIAHMGDAGIYHHNNRKINTHHNLIYDCGDALVQLVHDHENQFALEDVRFRHNTLVAGSPRQLLLKVLNKTDSAGILAFSTPSGNRGGLDSNTYVQPFDGEQPPVQVIWHVYTRGKEQRRFYTLSQWSRNFGSDLQSRMVAPRHPGQTNRDAVVRFWVNPTREVLKVKTERNLAGPDGKAFPAGVLELPPFSGRVLIRQSPAPIQSAARKE